MAVDEAKLNEFLHRSWGTSAPPSTPPTSSGVGWHKHNPDVFSGCERFFRPGYVANLVGRL